MPDNALKRRIPPTEACIIENASKPNMKGAGIKKIDIINLAILSELFWFVILSFIINFLIYADGFIHIC